MAVAVHVAHIALLPVNTLTGKVIDKGNPSTTINDVLNIENRFVVLPDTTLPNTANYPTVDAYIVLEAAAGFVVKVLNQTTIITYPAGS